jgi:hypothetical protein
MRCQIVCMVSAINLEFCQNEPKLEKGLPPAIVVEVRIAAPLAAGREIESTWSRRGSPATSMLTTILANLIRP